MTGRSLHVLMTADAVGGVWTYACLLARRLCAVGARVTLAVQGPAPSSDQRRAVEGVSGLAVVETGLALEWQDPARADREHARAVLEALARRVQPDVVHLNGYREALAEWPAPVVVAAHSCVATWWRACRGMEPDGEWDGYRGDVAAALDAADAWIAPTAAFRDAMVAAYRPHRRGTVVFNGVEPLPMATEEKQPFVLASGRLWDEAKNLGVLVRAAPQVGWPVRVAGPLALDGGEAPAPEDVEVLGILPRPALLDAMARAAIYASPALYEPFGLAVLEAAASGCAPVLSDVPAHRELWDGAALFVDARDPAALAGAIERLRTDAGLRERLQRAARATSATYTAERMATATLALYHTLPMTRRATEAAA